MDIEIINENIKILEDSETSLENIQELALLYTVKNNFSGDKVESELSDILPAYKKYLDAKRKFQMKEIDDTPMVDYMKLLCKEIQDFVLLLYNNTHTRKERHYIEETLSYLYKRFLE